MIETVNLQPVNIELKAAAPLDCFEQFIDVDFYTQVCFEKNRYNEQRATNGYQQAVDGKKRRVSYHKVAPITIAEIKKVLGIVLYMGVNKLPNRRMYCAPATRVYYSCIKNWQ